MLKHSGGVISDLKMSSVTEDGTNMDRGKNEVIPGEIGVVPARRHSGTGEQTRGKHQRVLQMGPVGGTIYGLKRRLPVEEVRIGDQAGGKNGLHNKLPIQQGLFRLLLQDHQQNGLELTKVGIGNQAGGKNGQHHQLRIQQGVFHHLLHDPQQNGLEVKRVGIGDQAGGENGLRQQLPIQEGVFRILLSDHLQNGLQVMEVFFWQTGSPPPVDNLEGIFPSPPGLSPAEQSTSEFSEPEPEYKEEDRGCWHAKRGDGKRNPRAEKAISLSSGQNESESRICFKALPTRDNSICPVVQQLMVIIGKVIRRADGDSMFSTANMICFFCREVRVQNYLRILEGTVFRFTGHVDGSGDVLEILATTLGLQRQKETGSYQKWVRDGGGLQLCHWSLDNFEKDGNAMHQSFQRVFMQSHQHSIFILEGKTLHRVEGFEHFINCSVHFLPFPEEEMTECSIAVRTTTSARKQAFWILLHVLCRNLFPSMEFREQLSAMASHPMHFKE